MLLTTDKRGQIKYRPHHCKTEEREEKTQEMWIRNMGNENQDIKIL